VGEEVHAPIITRRRPIQSSSGLRLPGTTLASLLKRSRDVSDKERPQYCGLHRPKTALDIFLRRKEEGMNI